MCVYTAVPIIVVVDYQMQLFTIFQIIWNQFFVLFCFVLFCLSDCWSNKWILKNHYCGSDAAGNLQYNQ